MADKSPCKPLQFSGQVHVQFREFLQSEMSTDSHGNQVFIGYLVGIFGTPPSGARFEAQVKLSVGANFTEDAYELTVHPALAQLAARSELRQAAFDYVNACMSSMVGPNWTRMTDLTSTNNVFIQPTITIVFSTGSDGW